MRKIILRLKGICVKKDERFEYYKAHKLIKQHFPNLSPNEKIILAIRYGLGKSIRDTALCCKISTSIVQKAIQSFDSYDVKVKLVPVDESF